ncbi:MULTISPECIES: type II secretion system minor pseudopilin GspH [unclassified Pseudomonas]|uniref:type II secretion system minor pseudopilin GspH n=1 Tax=unclassified Pseudomonas TaxID=196821 RepID=UPI001F41A8E9
MPIWATGRFEVPGQRGFSLLELLVVLAIAGLMTGMGVAWLDGGRSAPEQALQRLAAAVREQSAVARQAGQLRGLRWDGQRPEFVRHDGSGWVPDSVKIGDWPAQLRPDWPVGGQPPLLFTPEGWAHPGSVRWQWPEGEQRWRWAHEGRLTVTNAP